MRRKKERSKQGQTNKQGKATQHTYWQLYYLYIYMYMYIAWKYMCIAQNRKKRKIHVK